LSTDSYFEEDDKLDLATQYLLKVKFTDFNDTEGMVHDFCKTNKICQSDEQSLGQYVLLTLETESIAYDCQKIVKKIKDEFVADELLYNFIS